eukprot:tig00021348_g20531.t1
MDQFCKDSLRFGCLKGFKYFSLYLRGREELLVTVTNKAERSDAPFSPSKPSPSRATYFHSLDDGLPPASPSEREAADAAPSDETVFLIGGYARYKCPYVWLRSNHSRLRSSRGPADKDLPLKLQTTEQWRNNSAPRAPARASCPAGPRPPPVSHLHRPSPLASCWPLIAPHIKVWDIVAELVSSNTIPAPENPFKLDLTAFDGLPALERGLLCAAMTSFLREIFLSGAPFAELVWPDLQAMLAKHLETMPRLLAGREITPASMLSPTSSVTSATSAAAQTSAQAAIAAS